MNSMGYVFLCKIVTVSSSRSLRLLRGAENTVEVSLTTPSRRRVRGDFEANPSVSFLIALSRPSLLFSFGFFSHLYEGYRGIESPSRAEGFQDSRRSDRYFEALSLQDQRRRHPSQQRPAGLPAAPPPKQPRLSATNLKKLEASFKDVASPRKPAATVSRPPPG